MAEHTITRKTYYTVFAALMGLLVLTVAVAYVDLGSWNIVVAMSIAVLKMVLVITYFMHVKENSKVVWLFVASGFFWFFIMVVLTMPDFIARH